NDCLIALVYPPLLKLMGQRLLGGVIEGQHHYAGGALVQPVNNPRIGVVLERTVDQAVLLVRPLARHSEQAGGLVENQQIAVLIENLDTGIRHGGAARSKGRRLSQIRSQVAKLALPLARNKICEMSDFPT